MQHPVRVTTIIAHFLIADAASAMTHLTVTGSTAMLAKSCGILLVPYVFGGLVVTIALSAAGPVHRRYFVNLVGSALGAWLFIAAITTLGGERLLALCAGLGPITALLFTRGAAAGRSKKVAAGGAVAALVGAIWLFAQPSVLDIQIGSGKQQLVVGEVLEKRWTPLCRLDVRREDEEDPELLHILQDGMGGTFMYNKNQWKLRSVLDAHSVAFVPHINRNAEPDVVIIGIGGGADLRAAKDYKAKTVLGLEINPGMAQITGEDYKEFNGDLYGQEGVEVVVGEGRSTLRRLDRKFDLIQLAGADTYTAGASGAFVLSESYLYTMEALRDYFDHLKPGGTLGILRFCDQPPRETLRIFGMGLLELRRRGIEKPSLHAAIVRSSWNGGVVFSIDPLAEKDIEIYRHADIDPGEGVPREFTLVYVPGLEDEDGRASPFTELAQAIDAGTEEEFFASYPVDIRPVTDDSPFFFNFHHITDWVDTEDSEFARVTGLEFPIAPSVLRTLLLLTTSLVALLVILPLVWLRRESLRGHSVGRHLLFFLSVGAGFMFFEISTIQRMVLFLGHPTHSLTVVLFCFLFFAGLGSLWSGRFVRNHTRGIRISVVALCVMIALYLVFLGPILTSLLHLELPMRILVAIGLLAPLNFLMGMPFPLALTRLKNDQPQLVPWAIGANGGASVIGSILAVVIAMEAGFSSAAIAALVVYLLGMLAATTGPLGARAA